MNEQIYLYYTNDLHSHFENWSKIVGYFKEKKQERRRENQSYWLIDIGDHVDRFHPIAEAFMGKANVDLLNMAEYDIATIGNNEGITLDYQDLYHLYDEANFKLICANLQSTKGANPFWLQSSCQFESKNGVKIAFIGLTAPFNAFYNLLGWNIHSPYDVLDYHIKSIEKQADIIVLLSHLGINEDQEIARQYPQIDVIIGGHTHHLLRTGEYIENSLLTAAGKHGKYVGEVILTWDFQNNCLAKKEAYTTNINHFNGDQDTERKLQTYQNQANELLQETIITLEKPLEVGWFKETILMKKLVKTLQEWTDSDCSMLNAGLILDQLQAGKVTYADVHRICPHPINPCVVQLSGQELAEVIRGSYTKAFMELNLKGFGFRGEVIGQMIYSGLEVSVKKHDNGDFQVVKVLIDGLPLNPDKDYLVATADMFTFGKLLPEVARSKVKRFYMPEFLRDLLVHTLKTKIH
ncbi:bifunctional metallophosphatase/5'-nucleotidase [Aquibacillus albus]|uniref:2',3'-cyclic-nucleotide 2'-phosphodiesterase (5'-nucleotidase family) n=1 Tax=Aquibacillus albus TaxID=1168171 RepID=A0ABS2MZ65_9BACI|nr:bifunctional UDP-sugar hydrolase/5'-nucleotidase [Aquibacillus albus]MBM7570975.1 2',3'-cyclic-nucleotide 2'-phosphodiesterase (5'-nucleotidase family) [Aquibacillus albus]